MDDLLQEFIAETRETLAALAGEIIVWEADPTNRARLDAIFRFVHTVKGSCGFLDLPRLARLAHAAEDVLQAVREGNRIADTRLVNAVLGIVDRIGVVVEAIDAGISLDDSGDYLLIAALNGNAPVEPVEAGPAPLAPMRAQARSVRLSVELLDRMMSGMSEMVLARNELARRLRENAPDPAAEAALERLSLTVADMRETVTQTRMQTIDALFSALPRMVRDTAAGLAKQVTLSIAGADVELDREMIEMMRDPLVHIVRNAIDHGVETPAERAAAGKPAGGRLLVCARQSGNTIVIEIADDGRGIDTGRLIAKLAAGGADLQALLALPDKAKLDLVFEPGLSSRDEVTAISGRGVGMDVVRANIEQIGGRIELDNRPGRGLTIVIHVPLTLSILPTIVVGAGAQRFALARQSIEEIVAARTDAVRIDAVGDGQLATVRGRRLALIDLPALLGLGDGGVADRTMLVIVSVAGGSLALAVDSVLDSEDLVVKPVAPAVMACGLYAGQTLPDTGLPMLVLDTAGIAAACGIAFDRDAAPSAPDPAAVDAGWPALLFVDLDGARRALPLAAVDRVEQVDPTAASFVGGRLRLHLDGQVVPLVSRGEIDRQTKLSLIRLRDGTAEIAYAVRDTCGIVRIAAEVVQAAADSGMVGVTLVDDRPVELVDVHWLFAEIAMPAAAERPVLCVLGDGRGGWMETFLAPVLERAGYRIVAAAEAGERPSVVLAMDDAAVAAPVGARVVRLSDRRDGPGVFRYDRSAVLAALAGECA